MRSLPLTSASPAVQQDPSLRRGADSEATRSAQEFEAILLRNLLSTLEKTTKGASRGPLSGGGEIHTSMMVGVLADALAAAGGIGIAEMITRSATDNGGQAGRVKGSDDDHGAQGSEKAAVLMDGTSTQR